MSQNKRIIIAVVVILVIAIAVVGIDFLRRGAFTSQTTAGTPLPAGSVPIYLDKELIGGFSPEDLENLQEVEFVDTDEGKSQDGWLLRDILLIYLPQDTLQGSQITVSSSSRDKSIQLTWEEVADESNMVMFDLSNRKTVKLVSLLEKLDTRDEWIQDTDRIEVDTQ
jgi:hypothetical protein